MAEEIINISKKEYEELLENKQALIDLLQLKKQAGAAYKKYKDMQDADRFYTNRYGDIYKVMKEQYTEYKKQNIY